MAKHGQMGSMLSIFDENTVLLLHMEGDDASTALFDSARGGNAPHAITVNNDAVIDTAQYKYGSSSLLLDGTGDYLSVASDSDFDFRSGDFTMEGWIRPATERTVQNFFSVGTTEYESIGVIYNIYDVDQIYVVASTNGTSWDIFLDAGAVSANTWYHIAFVRDGSTFRLFVEGTQVDSATSASALVLDNYAVKIGAHFNLTQGSFDGWMDEVRFSTTARYTSNFTPAGPFKG